MPSLIIIIALLLCFSCPASSATKVVIHEDRVKSFAHMEKLNKDYEFREDTVVTLPNGEKRVKLKQYYKGIPVWDNSIVVKDR